MNPAKKSLTVALLCTFGCYLIWGLQPMYWALLSDFDTMFVMCVRVVMAMLFTNLYLICAGRFCELRATFRDGKIMRYLLPASVFLCADWTLFIWAVSHGHVIDSALGYYFDPLVIFLSGILLVKEKGHPLEYVAVGLACVGVIISVLYAGSFPLLSLAFALIWPTYATIKRFANADPVVSFAVEVTLMTPFALAAMLIFYRGGGGLASVETVGNTILLILSGIITALPMILYNMVVNELPFKTIGILQYAGTTISFLCGALLMHEAVTQSKLIMFGFIWAGLIVYTIGNFKKHGQLEH